MSVKCKRCPHTPRFKDISSLRKHQWKEHRDSFAALEHASRHPSRKTIAKRKQNMENARAALDQIRQEQEQETLSLVPVASPNGTELTLSQAIENLERKHVFLGDVISLLRGIQNQPAPRR